SISRRGGEWGKKPGFEARSRTSNRGLTPPPDRRNWYYQPCPPSHLPTRPPGATMRARLCGPTALALVLGCGLASADPVPETWWSFKPLARPKVSGTGHPVDAFIVAKLREKGLSPAPEADRRTLVRRVYFDLLGRPPAPEH